MNYKLKNFVIVATVLCLSFSANADYRILHHFAGGSGDGSTPYGSLICSGSVLYGTTFYGGSFNLGTIFQMNIDGTGFQLLHSFTSDSIDGTLPIGALLLCDSTLYGTASSRGSSYGGTVFKIRTDGSDFAVLRRFSVSDGMWPWDSLIVSDAILYGLNAYGGIAAGWSGKGTAFKINTDGSGFEVLRTFSGSPNDGHGPHGSFLLKDSTLYATTGIGGTYNKGAVFKMSIDGSQFQILHSFEGAPGDGQGPYAGAFASSGSTLYAMAGNGGSGDYGTIYKINTDGTGYQVLHDFAGGSNGQKPFGSLILSGIKLFGVTSDEGSATNGTIFSINTDGTGFEIIHRFSVAEGRYPYGKLVLLGPTLYGMTAEGGDYNKGVIFAYDLEFADCNEVKAAGFRLEADIHGDGDCNVDFHDFSIFASQWLSCNNPQDANCIP
jgi:uncharacterized repeat protein (TIGR03803 family)